VFGSRQPSLRNAALAADLETLRADDQRYRGEGVRLWNEKGIDSPEARAVWDKQGELDKNTPARLEAIVKEFGWPGVRLVGLAGADAAFLILDHAPLALQRKYLPMLQKAAANQDAVPTWPAVVDDRVRTNAGLPQRCGTAAQGMTRTVRRTRSHARARTRAGTSCAEML
jgi:hypothetical protein